MCHLPTILRVLVIDDMVGNSKALREYISIALFAMAVQSPRGKQLAYVDVQFAKSPSEGIECWEEEPFDLTLIDSHFDQESEPGNAFEKHALILNAKYQGLILYNLFSAWMASNDRYPYRREVADIVVWSSFDKKDLKKYPDTAQQPEAFLPKRDVDKLIKRVAEAVERVCKAEYTEEQARNRVLSFVSLAKGGTPPGFTWPLELVSCNWLVRDEGDQFPYLDEIWRDNKGTTLRLAYRMPLGIKPDSVIGLNGEKVDEERVRQCAQSEHSSDDDSVQFPLRGVQEGRAPIHFLGLDFPDRIFAAATPLTGVSVAGQDRAVRTLRDKVIGTLGDTLRCGDPEDNVP